MRARPTSRRASRGARQGFTLVEIVFAFAIIGILTLMTIPRISRVLEANRTRQAAATVAGDLERAFTLAARYRRPMRLSCVCGSGTYSVADRTGGTVRLSRDLRNGSELRTLTLAFSQTPVDIFPSGVSNFPDTVTITSGISTRRIVMTTAGQVRILP
jgi:prepilin-type N-terminal cleavage/methylation domain-containing protein